METSDSEIWNAADWWYGIGADREHAAYLGYSLHILLWALYYPSSADHAVSRQIRSNNSLSNLHLTWKSSFSKCHNYLALSVLMFSLIWLLILYLSMFSLMNKDVLYAWPIKQYLPNNKINTVRTLNPIPRRQDAIREVGSCSTRHQCCQTKAWSHCGGSLLAPIYWSTGRSVHVSCRWHHTMSRCH